MPKTKIVKYKKYYKKINFETLSQYCLHGNGENENSFCSHCLNSPGTGGFGGIAGVYLDGECEEKKCPIWKKLKRVA